MRRNSGTSLPYQRDGRCLVIPQPSLRSVREYFWIFACSDLVLDGAPEVGPKYLAVMLQQRGQGRLWESQELQKFLGKNVVLSHGEPRLGGDFFLRSARFGQFAKIAVRKETKLIVIVKDHAAMPGHAKHAADRSEARIKELHDRLHITPAQETLWGNVAQTMRDNGKTFRASMTDRSTRLKTMTAVDDLKSYQIVADQHSDGLKRLIPAFEALYATMTPAQQKHADRVFGEHQRHAHI